MKNMNNTEAAFLKKQNTAPHTQAKAPYPSFKNGNMALLGLTCRCLKHHERHFFLEAF